MTEHCCGDCEHYCWIEDYYDDGSYVNEEFCDEVPDKSITHRQPACEKFEPLYK